jgi:hypothetical protein
MPSQLLEDLPRMSTADWHLKMSPGRKAVRENGGKGKTSKKCVFWILIWLVSVEELVTHMGEGVRLKNPVNKNILKFKLKHKNKGHLIDTYLGKRDESETQLVQYCH